MAKLTWSADNFRIVVEEMLVKAQDPVGDKAFRDLLLDPDQARTYVAARIEEPPGGWQKQFVGFQDETISTEEETINVFALPKGIGDTDYTAKRGCSYTRTY